MMIAIHELASTELEQRALNAWSICRRVLDADDSEPSDETQAQVGALIARATGDLSADVDKLYATYQARIKGSWPDLGERRARAVSIAASEVDIDFLHRRRKRLPLGDVLRAPRYAAVLSHWAKARAAAENEKADVPAALQGGILAVEALAKIVVQDTCATLGECIKELRSRKLIDAGADKLLEGLWVHANAAPGVRHGATTTVSLSDRDWRVLRPMFEAALTLLIAVDVARP
jgi:hypothetical protein